MLLPTPHHLPRRLSEQQASWEVVGDAALSPPECRMFVPYHVRNFLSNFLVLKCVFHEPVDHFFVHVLVQVRELGLQHARHLPIHQPDFFLGMPACPLGYDEPFSAVIERGNDTCTEADGGQPTHGGRDLLFGVEVLDVVQPKLKRDGFLNGLKMSERGHECTMQPVGLVVHPPLFAHGRTLGVAVIRQCLPQRLHHFPAERLRVIRRQIRQPYEPQAFL